MPRGTEREDVGQRREGAAMHATALVGGPTDLLEFVLPLWAGSSWGASALQVGALVALEMAVSLLARAFAGVLADRRERRLVAAVGAGLYTLSCAGYATATLVGSLGVVGGVGGAPLWGSLRAVVGERLAEDSSVYARLFSREETKSWVAFVVGLALLYPALGCPGLLWACAGACAVGTLALLRAPRDRTAPTSVRHRTLRACATWDAGCGRCWPPAPLQQPGSSRLAARRRLLGRRRAASRPTPRGERNRRAPRFPGRRQSPSSRAPR